MQPPTEPLETLAPLEPPMQPRPRRQLHLAVQPRKNHQLHQGVQPNKMTLRLRTSGLRKM
jgi:hypothetical protein